ncbi:MAG: hypothetical protein MJK18_06465 [Bdellovibrionales bacterium]|nr:hypothetical protein [Bdellovibrionales bacterium]
MICTTILIIVNPIASASAPRCADSFRNVQNAQEQKGQPRWIQQVRDFVPAIIRKLRAVAIDKTLDIMGFMKGLPRYLNKIKSLKDSGRYLQYKNFGEMGLAELGISVRVNGE